MISKVSAIAVRQDGALLSSETCRLDQQFSYQLATSLGQPCYVAAEVEGSLVKDEGLSFTIGDGSIIGTYQNVPLQQNTEYSVAVAIVVHAKVCSVRKLSIHILYAQFVYERFHMNRQLCVLYLVTHIFMLINKL